MTLTLGANYREILSQSTLELIDRLLDEEHGLPCILEFIDEYSEEEFQDYYEEYVELGEKNGYEAVDAFIELHDLFDLKFFEASFIGDYPSHAKMAEDFLEDEVDRLRYMIVVDWKETAEYLLDDGDIEVSDNYYFRRHY